MALRFQLSRKWRERLHRWREKLVWYFGYPWYLISGTFRWIGSTFSNAWGTRNLRYMLQGVPAVLAAVGVSVLGVSVIAQDRTNLSIEYYRDAVMALANKDYPLARTDLEKAIRLESDKQDYKFRLALALKGEDKTEHALAIMRKLAPDEGGTGYAPAHLWLADLVASTFAPSKQTMNFVENHYLRATNAGVTAGDFISADASTAAAIRLGWMYSDPSMGRLAEAEKYLLKGSDKIPEVKLRLAAVYLALNRKDDGQRVLDSAVATFRKSSERDLDDHNARKYWAEALVMQEKFPEAIAVLNSGKTLSTNPIYSLAIAQVYDFWERNISTKPNTTVEERLAMIQRGLQANPTYAPLLLKLGSFAKEKGEEGKKSREMLEKMLSEGKSVPIIHMILGNLAYSEGKNDEAKMHWERSYALDSNMGLVANNLAWILSHQKEPDLNRALEIITGAIDKVKMIPQFYGTRGEILLKMGRFKEALPDLEKGIAGEPKNPLLHEAIAEVYKMMGNHSMANVHSTKAKDLRAQGNKPNFEELGPNKNLDTERKLGVPEAGAPKIPGPPEKKPGG